jgi:hypothetical protein
VDDDLRQDITSAMKNTSSTSKRMAKETQKTSDTDPNSKTKAKKARRRDSDTELQPDTHALQIQRRRKTSREPSPDFVRLSSSAPTRLNDIAQAPPELKGIPRLSRLAEKSKAKAKQNIGGGKGLEAEDEEDGGAGGILSAQQKRMMELEREKAIARYRALKETKLKGTQAR